MGDLCDKRILQLSGKASLNTPQLDVTWTSCHTSVTESVTTLELDDIYITADKKKLFHPKTSR